MTFFFLNLWTSHYIELLYVEFDTMFFETIIQALIFRKMPQELYIYLWEKFLSSVVYNWKSIYDLSLHILASQFYRYESVIHRFSELQVKRVVSSLLTLMINLKKTWRK